MNMTMFQQFESPELFMMPTSFISTLMPLLLLHHKPKLLGNRMALMMALLLKTTLLNMTKQLSSNGQKWSRLLVSLLMFIMASNLLGLLPYTFTTTSQLSTNMALALPLWLSTIIAGAVTKPSTTLAHMLPEGSPTVLVPFMVTVETISLLMRPIALGVRLTANITAGHLLMTMTGSTTLALMNTSTMLSLLTLTMLLLLSFLEMAVACIQAYVFVLLTILYLQENT